MVGTGVGTGVGGGVGDEDAPRSAKFHDLCSGHGCTIEKTEEQATTIAKDPGTTEKKEKKASAKGKCKDKGLNSQAKKKLKAIAKAKVRRTKYKLNAAQKEEPDFNCLIDFTCVTNNCIHIRI